MSYSVITVGELVVRRVAGLGLSVTFGFDSVEVSVTDGPALVHIACHRGGWVATQLGPDPTACGQAVESRGQVAFRSSADPAVIADFVTFICERRLAIREAA